MDAKTDESQASAGQVERPVRPLVDKLRDCVQGLDLGADGACWSPDPALLREAANELEDRAEALEDWKERWRHERERWQAHADAMAQALEAFEAQGSDKTAALRAYRAFRA